MQYHRPYGFMSPYPYTSQAEFPIPLQRTHSYAQPLYGNFSSVVQPPRVPLTNYSRPPPLSHLSEPSVSSVYSNQVLEERPSCMHQERRRASLHEQPVAEQCRDIEEDYAVSEHEGGDHYSLIALRDLTLICKAFHTCLIGLMFCLLKYRFQLYILPIST